jgi:hypothetical protein
MVYDLFIARATQNHKFGTNNPLSNLTLHRVVVAAPAHPIKYAYSFIDTLTKKEKDIKALPSILLQRMVSCQIANWKLDSMGTVDVSIKIYECGDRIKDDFRFNPCPKKGTPQCPGRLENPLASERVKEKCGRHDFRNP